MTELPPEMIEALQQKNRAQMKHNWMYSFMPVTDMIYLVGYCKVCDTSVSSRLETGSIIGSAVITKSNIPKWGCVPPEELG